LTESSWALGDNVGGVNALRGCLGAGGLDRRLPVGEHRGDPHTRLSETQPHWNRPTPQLGGDEPEWDPMLVSRATYYGTTARTTHAGEPPIVL